MRAPAFWDAPPDSPGFLAQLLGPLGRIYAAGTARRLARGTPGFDPGVPVICVGNLTAGGAGKTPTVIALLETLGRGVVVVSKGHGGTLQGPVEVDPTRHSADAVGDEPLLIAAFGSVVVAKDRVAGAKHALSLGARAIVLDDGFQDPSLAKTLSLVVADAGRGFGNGRCLPAGPLREPVAIGLARADALVTLGTPVQQDGFGKKWGQQVTLPRLEGQLRPLEMGMPWKGRRVLAFAGIGYPDKFFATLRALEADVVGTVALDDHAPLTPALITRLTREAKAARAQLVCTEKDSVRLPEALRREVLPLPVRLRFKDDAAFRSLLRPLGLL